MPKTRRLSDAALVRRSQQGDRRAFSALLGRYDRRLRGLAHALLLDQGEMDVALGTGYMRAWRDVVRLGAKDDVAAWLYRATYNACIDQLRRTEQPPTPPETGLAKGLAGLPAAHRVAVVLVDREGFSPSSAARIMGLPQSEFATTLGQARERLAPHLPDTPAPTPPDDGDARPAHVARGDTSPPEGADAGATDDADGDVAEGDGPVVFGNGTDTQDEGPRPDEPVREPAAVGAGQGHKGAEVGSGAPTDDRRHAAESNGNGTGDDAGLDASATAAHADTSDVPPEAANGATGAERADGPGSNGGGDGRTSTPGDGDGDGDGRASAPGDGDASGNGNAEADAEADVSESSNGNGDRAGGSRGRGRRARKRAKHAARQQTGRPDPAGGPDGDAA